MSAAWPSRSEQLADDQLVGDVVLGDQDRHPPAAGRGAGAGSAAGSGSAASRAGAGRTSTLNRNRLPLPGLLSTEISPPIASTSRLQIARPRPVPPNRREIVSVDLRELAEQQADGLGGNADAGVG